MRISRLILALVPFLCLPFRANANTVTYSYVATYDSTVGANLPFPGQVTGTFTWDYNFGLVDLTLYGAPGPMVTRAWGYPADGSYIGMESAFGDATNPQSEMTIDLRIPTYLITTGTSGLICSQSAPCGSSMQNVGSIGYYVPEVPFTSGYVTVTSSTGVAPTPEPASMALLLTGMCGVAGTLRTRKSRTC